MNQLVLLTLVLTSAVAKVRHPNWPPTYLLHDADSPYMMKIANQYNRKYRNNEEREANYNRKYKNGEDRQAHYNRKYRYDEEREAYYNNKYRNDEERHAHYNRKYRNDKKRGVHHIMFTDNFDKRRTRVKKPHLKDKGTFEYFDTRGRLVTASLAPEQVQVTNPDYPEIDYYDDVS